MKTETEGLSREEFEKAMKRDNRTWEFDRDEVGKYRKIEPCYAWIGWQAASSLHLHGKHTDPCPPVAESPSQAGTQPKCNCRAGDDAYLACHADVCALKKWAAPRYEVSQATKEEWIDATERVPQNSDGVLVEYFTSGDCDVYVAHYHAGTGWFWADDTAVTKARITRWTGIPWPPRGT